MIIEVALGIVLAVFILAFLPLIFRVGIALVGVAALIAVIAAAVWGVSENARELVLLVESVALFAGVSFIAGVITWNWPIYRKFHDNGSDRIKRGFSRQALQALKQEWGTILGSGVIVVLLNVLMGMVMLLPVVLSERHWIYVPAALVSINVLLFLFRKKTNPAC